MIPSFFYLLFFFLISCVAKIPEGVERFAVKECYKLDKNEKMLGIDSIVSEQYTPIYSLGKHEIPLNRAFQNKNYKTFIGLALNSKAENLYNDHIQTNEFSVLKNEVEKENYHLLMKKDNIFIYRLIYTEPVQKITVVLNFVSEKEQLITSFFENKKTFIDEKINCNK